MHRAAERPGSEVRQLPGKEHYGPHVGRRVHLVSTARVVTAGYPQPGVPARAAQDRDIPVTMPHCLDKNEMQANCPGIMRVAVSQTGPFLRAAPLAPW